MPVRTGRICRSGVATLFSLGNSHMEAIYVGFSKSTLLYFKDLGVFELLLVGADAALSRAHVVGQLLLAWETALVVPIVLEDHRVEQFGAD